MSQHIISKKRSIIIFLLASLFYFYQMILQVSPDVLGPHLIERFSVSEHRLGLLTSVFFFAYMLMQIPGGILLDRWGAHRMLSLASLLCAIGACLFSIAPYFFLASISRLLIGIGAAFAYIGGLKLISNWYSGKRFSLMMGLLSTIGMFGGIVGEAPLAKLIEHVGWRESMFILSLIGLGVSSLIFFFIKDTPLSSFVERQDTPTLSSQQKQEVFHNKQLWFTSFYESIISIIPIILTSLYGVPFLKDKYALDEVHASRIISVIFIGFMIAAPAWGWFSDYIRRRLPPMYAAAIASPLLLFLLVYCSFPLPVVALLLFLLGFFSYGSITAFSTIHEIIRPQYLATALGFLNMFDDLGAAFMLPIFGRLLDAFGHPSHQHLINVYSLQDYQDVFMIVIAIMIIPIILLRFIKETHAKSLFPEEEK